MSVVIKQSENIKYLTLNAVQVSIGEKKSASQICLKHIDEPSICFNLRSRQEIIDTITLLKETLKETGYEEIT